MSPVTPSPLVAAAPPHLHASAAQGRGQAWCREALSAARIWLLGRGFRPEQAPRCRHPAVPKEMLLSSCPGRAIERPGEGQAGFEGRQHHPLLLPRCHHVPDTLSEWLVQGWEWCHRSSPGAALAAPRRAAGVRSGEPAGWHGSAGHWLPLGWHRMPLPAADLGMLYHYCHYYYYYYHHYYYCPFCCSTYTPCTSCNPGSNTLPVLS